MMNDYQMDRAQFVFKYDGGDADRHAVDMRLLGRSLIGIDKIMSDAVIVLAERREPRKKERSPLIIVAESPKIGSATIYGELAPVFGTLPLVWDFLNSSGGKLLWQFMSFVLKSRGGRKGDAQQHLEAMLEQLRITENGRAEADARAHDTIRYMFDRMLEKLAPAAREVVAPIGPSVDRLTVGGFGVIGTSVDIPMADAIRSGGDLTVGDQEQMVVRVDGYQHHNRTLKIERLDGEGYMTAYVTDPAFEIAPNLYTEAAAQKAVLLVEGKKTFRDGRIERVHLSNAIRIIPEAA